MTHEIPTAIPTLLTMLELLMTLPSLLVVGRLPEFKVADCKPEVHRVFGMDHIDHPNSNGYPIFSTMPELMVTLSTLPDVSRFRELKMEGFEPEVHYISIEWM
jgi:hypothetical protein